MVCCAGGKGALATSPMVMPSTRTLSISTAVGLVPQAGLPSQFERTMKRKRMRKFGPGV
jgi:hypothetical protein